MGQAREVLDTITEAILAGDRDAIARCYAVDAVADTPDEGRLVGRDAIADYLTGFARAFPEIEWEPISQLEVGDTAIDEGYIIGTNTGPLLGPDGEIPATGRTIRLRECDLLTVRDGLAVSHRFHYDQMDMLTQLGLMGSETIVLPEQTVMREHTPA
jgi:predicted ester cyclase